MAVTWTGEQQQVISLRNRNILVSAAAGSGKTAVLVQRILSKILDKDHPVDIDRLLIMTFTRAAAGEMRERLSAALEQALYEDPDNEHLQRQMTLIHTAQITTIDGFCSYIIRNYFHMIDLDPGCRTAEEGELKLLREDVLKDLLEEAYAAGDEQFLELVECYASGKTDDGLKDLILKVYEAAMSHPFPDEWLEQCRKAYQVDNLEELRKQPWISLLWETAVQELEQSQELAEYAKTICGQTGGPYLYEEALESDLLLIASLKKTLKEKDYNRMADSLKNLSFARLSGKKMPEADDSKKEQVKLLREEEKEVLKGLAKRCFAWEEEELLRLLKYCKGPMESLISLTLRFWECFAARKREKNLLDFTDMEHFALEILVQKDGEKLTPSQAARELSAKYDEVMVDEYQDSNYVQETITTMVSGWADGRKNIFMVGDVKQSIYRFRLARPELFMEKYHRFSTEDSDEQRIDLHKNFRSRPQVLNSVNYLFRRIMGEDLGGIVYDRDNALYPGAQFPEGADEEFLKTEVLLVEKDGEELDEEKGTQTAQELEALAIAHRIRQIVGREQVLDKETGAYRTAGYGDIVILLRSAYGWAETFREVLAARGIPAYTVSRTGYFSAQEVVTLLNFLRVCDNPLQDIPLAGVLHSPIGNCTVQELAVIRKDFPEGLLYESLCAFVRDGQLVLFPEDNETEALKAKIRGFLELLEEIRGMAAYTPIHELILHILRRTGYEDYVRAMPGGNQRGANLRMLVEKAMDYEKTSYRGLFNFVRYIENLQKYEVDFGEVNLTEAGSGSVQIMTIHKSKGLEFPIVFAAGMGKQFNFQDLNARLLIHPDLGLGADAILPKKRIVIPTLQKQMIRRELKKESLGEELRVLYVALTRAKEKLIITGTLSDLEGQVIRMSDCRDQETGGLLSLGRRMAARSFWSYLLPALANHSAMKELYLEYGKKAKDFQDEGAEFVIRRVTAADLIQAEVVELSDSLIQEELLKNWDCERVYDEDLRNLIRERFTFRYPYEYLGEMPVKVSVSELKKRSYQGEQEKEEAVFFEPDIVPLIPEFIAREAEEYQGAARGTAYHRVMECLDYAHAEDAAAIREQVARLAEQKKMSPLEAECVREEDILTFVESGLGQRMKTAALGGKLFREQPFVMSVDVSELRAEWTGGERVLVQGIIDAYFIEGDEIVLVDYKTDRVRRGEEQKLVDLYHTQLEDYARALERMVKKPVKECYIYSFTLREPIRLDGRSRD